MTKKVYKSSIYDKTLYGIMVVGVLIPGLWALLFGIEKRSYNIPLLVIDLLFCIYSVFIYARFFSHKVVMTDEYIKIYDINRTICIYYQNIIDIRVSKNVCFIIDRMDKRGRSFIRGTDPLTEYSYGSNDIKINSSKVASIKKAYIDGYYEIIDSLLSKCGMEYVREVAVAADKKKLSFNDVMEIFTPYILLMSTFLIGLLYFGTIKKGYYNSWMIIIAKLVLPLYVVVIIYTLILKYIPFVKRIIGDHSYKSDIPVKNTILFLAVNIFVSAAVITFFFYVLKNYSI